MEKKLLLICVLRGTSIKTGKRTDHNFTVKATHFKLAKYYMTTLVTVVSKGSVQYWPGHHMAGSAFMGLPWMTCLMFVCSNFFTLFKRDLRYLRKPECIAVHVSSFSFKKLKLPVRQEFIRCSAFS